MLNLKKVAVTGGLSSGKSTVCRFLSELGARVVYSDEIVHGLLAPENPVGQKVIELLGADILVQGKIDRSIIASKVFAHPKLLRSLEQLVHPIVYNAINIEYEKATQDQNITLFVAEVPLLFETGGESIFDSTIAVISDNETSWNRFLKFTGYEREDFDRRMANQLSPLEKAKKAQYVINNNGSLEQLYEQIKKIYNNLTINTPV
jgi:dephospho-CoA kinase